jgi:hypothetical protein
MTLDNYLAVPAIESVAAATGRESSVIVRTRFQLLDMTIDPLSSTDLRLGTPTNGYQTED